MAANGITFLERVGPMINVPWLLGWLKIIKLCRHSFQQLNTHGRQADRLVAAVCQQHTTNTGSPPSLGGFAARDVDIPC